MGDQKRLSLAEEEEEEKNAGGILGKMYTRFTFMPLTSVPEGVSHASRDRDMHNSVSYLYIFLYFISFFVTQRYRKQMGGTVHCCPPVAAARNCTPEARTNQVSWGFTCSQRRHSSPSGVPAPLPAAPRLMKHQRTFHGVRFILIKRSRLLFFFFFLLFPALPDERGCQRCSSPRSCSLLGGWIQGTAWGDQTCGFV